LPPTPQADIEAGFEHLKAGRVDQAAKAARRVLAKHPHHHGALNLAGLVCLEQGDLPEAVTRLEHAVTLAADQAIYHCNLGVAYRQAHRYTEAVASCDRAIALRPGYLNALVNLGAAHFAAQQYDEALLAYDQALEVDPTQGTLHAYRADALRELGRVRGAIAAYERALELEPDLHHAVGNLGLTLLGVGQPDRALELCRRATELAPQSGMGQMNLGTALRTLGRLQEAMEVYATAYELASDSAQLCTLIGEMWQEVSDTPEAIGWYQKALEIEPDRVEARCGLAAATLAGDDTTAAVAQYREILEEHRDHFQARIGLGSALWHDGDAEGAVEQCRQAVELRPEDAGALAQLATILASAGDVTAANQTNRQALEINPRCVGALANLAQNLRGKLPEQDAGQMEKLLAAPWAREGARAGLHFGLGHYYDGQRQYDKAALHIQEANALHTAFKRERGWSYDPQECEQHADRLIAEFGSEFFERTAGMGDPSRVPVFIVGMPRSGTTLTEQILASHPRVFGAGERNFAGRGFNSLPALVGRSGDAVMDCLDSLRAEDVQRIAGWHLQQLRGLTQKAGLAETDYDKVADKMPENYNWLGWIVTAFPNAKIIHCRRDVRDVAVSCWVTQFKEIRWAFDLEHIALRIIQYQRVMDHWRRTLPVPMLEIDYEETVADQEAQTAKLLDFVGLAWDDKCLNFHQTQRLVRTASVTQVRQPIYRRSVARWRNYEKALKPLLEILSSQ